MHNANHILIVDDDREIRELLSKYLTGNGFSVTLAGNGKEMKQRLREQRTDLIVLDLMLPGDDGLTLCRELRTRSNVPVIMLTAMGEELERIIGLEVGADDYLPKPFNPRELLARIKAVIRRTATRPELPHGDSEPSVLGFEGWRFDTEKRELCSPSGSRVVLSSGEFRLLSAFALHPQRILSRDLLLDLAQGREAQPFDRSIDVQVSRLRNKLETEPHNPILIKTVRGLGYMFTPKVKSL